jgi:hypothetical protein
LPSLVYQHAPYRAVDLIADLKSNFNFNKEPEATLEPLLVKGKRNILPLLVPTLVGNGKHP